jgi:exodeoxyribonuclease-3
MSMKIATFNANSIRSRLDIVLSWLADHRPDVLCLQETKVVDSLFPAQPFTDAGYHVVFKGQKAYNGVAIVSRIKPAGVGTGLDDGGQPDETRLITAKIGPVRIVNTYVPQGRTIDDPMYAYKIEWFRRLKNYFERRFTPRMNLIWLGDLNIAPAGEDIHNADQQEKHVCYHVDARNAFEDTRAWGLHDVFRKHHPEPGQYTFFDYRTPGAVKRGEGWRIDHILTTRRLAAKSTDCYIDLEPRMKEKPSDHTFLVAEFAVGKGN